MLLVILGHSLQLFVLNRPDGVCNEEAFQLWKAIYSFHMPAFYFVSGILFSLRPAKTLPTALKKSLALLFFCIAAQLIAFPLCRLIYAPQAVSHLEEIKQALRPVLFGDGYILTVTWFLTSLALVELLAWFYLRGKTWSKMVVLLIVLAGFYLGLTHPVYQCQTWAPGLLFYLLGSQAVAARRFVPFRGRLSFSLMAAVSALVVGITYSLNRGNEMFRWHFAAGEIADRTFAVLMINGKYGFIPLFLLTALAGIAMLTFTALAIKDTLASRLLGWIGQSTLALLILNGFVLAAVEPRLALVLPAAGPNARPLVWSILLTALQVLLLPLVRRPLQWLYSACQRGAGLVIDRVRPAGPQREMPVF